MPSPLIAVSRPEKTIDPADASDIPFPQPEKATIAAAAIAAPAGIEQHATPDSAEGVISEAEAINGYTPAYPRISKNRGEEGTVTLAVQVLLDGSVGKVELLQSSGFSRLDAAAVKGACKTAFRPAIRSGHAAESTTQLSYTFRLTDD
jgi:protein TonB